MAQLLIRDIPEALVLALEKHAAANGRSAEAEHRVILEVALRSGRAEFRKRAARLRAGTAGRIQGESADLIREDRDARYPSPSTPRSR
jgi:plasmid stability protein